MSDPKSLLLESVPEEFELDATHGGAVTKERFGEPVVYDFDAASYVANDEAAKQKDKLAAAGFEKGYVRLWYDDGRQRGICAWIQEFRDGRGAESILDSMRLAETVSDLLGVRVSESGEHSQYAWVQQRRLAHIIVHGRESAAIGRSLVLDQRSRLAALLP